jgi:hypothetical protein
LLSAAQVHELTDEIPRAVQITYPPVEVFKFAAATIDLGMERVEPADGETVRITGKARTVVDLIRLRRSVGQPKALIALRRYLARPGGRPAALIELARPLDVLGPVRAAVDVLESS